MLNFMISIYRLIHLNSFLVNSSSPIKYEHETVIVENEYPHSATHITTASNHHIYTGNDTDRHSEEYITPISSPRLQHQPSAPQKLPNSINNTVVKTQSATITMTQSSINTVPISSISPNTAQQNQVCSMLLLFIQKTFNLL